MKRAGDLALTGDMMRLGVLTSTDIRHRFVVQSLRARFEVAAVGYENTGYSPAVVDDFGLTDTESEIVAEHFRERGNQEQMFFGGRCEPLIDGRDCAVLQIAPGQLNTEATLGFLTDARVDAVAVFGTNLIKRPLIDRWPGRMVNMHLGLSPYYRGTATNFYPLLNEEPEYVGATIHLIDPGIDSGPILKHARPDIVESDRPHTIGCKAIVAGVRAMIDVLERLEANRLDPVAQWKVPNPKLYLRKDYHPRQVVELYHKLDDGLIEKYVRRAHEVALRVRLVS